MTTKGIMGKYEMFSSLESWAGNLGYVVEVYEGRFYVQKDWDAAKPFVSKDEVVDFILEEIRNSCCGGV